MLITKDVVIYIYIYEYICIHTYTYINIDAMFDTNSFVMKKFYEVAEPF